MALIIDFTDNAGVFHKNAFFKFDYCKSKAIGIQCNTYIYHNFGVYEAGKRYLEGRVRSFIIPPSQTYKNIIQKSLKAGFNEQIAIYDLLKSKNGNIENLKFYKTITSQQYNENGQLVDVENQVMDFVWDQLEGIDFTSGISTFSQEEFDLALNGLANLNEGDVYFNETTRQFLTWQNSNWFISAQA